ncbi:MAG: TolC family protein [Kiritimatiellia bacterium]
MEIARDTLASRNNALELTRVKFDDGQGIVSELDVAQATQVAATQSSIASLRRQIALAENALSLLLGGNPGAIPRGQTLTEQWQPAELPAGLPSDLLLRRPDLRAAEQQLVSANANIGVARAAYFPAISLTGALGLQSDDLGDLFDTGLLVTSVLPPSLTAPIFQAGRIRSGVRAWPKPSARPPWPRTKRPSGPSARWTTPLPASRTSANNWWPTRPWSPPSAAAWNCPPCVTRAASRAAATCWTPSASSSALKLTAVQTRNASSWPPPCSLPSAGRRMVMA